MKICLTGALIITIPVLIFNLIMFIRPAFEKTLSMKRILITTMTSTVLAISGAAFAFYCILPGTLKFFHDFEVNGLKALISADSYLNFITSLIIMFVIVSQIPLLILFIDHINPIKPINLIKKGKWIITGSLIVTVIQPFTYDLVVSLMIALPIIALYYLSVGLVIMQHMREKNKKTKIARAIVLKPSFNPASEMVLDNLIYNYLLDELVKLEKPRPVSTLPSGHSVMEFRKTSNKPTKAKPVVAVPAWVEERNAKREKFSRQVPVFSDIIKPGPNRALA